MDDAKTITERAIERWNAHDREGFLALYDDEIRFVDESMGRELVGREEFGKGFYDLWAEAYPDNQLKDPLVFTDGEMVCFHGRFTGTHTGVYHGLVELPPTGKPVDGKFVFISEVRDGKVKSGRILYDRLTTLEQEGMISLEQFAAQLVSA
jgi:predicted ester cyclase